jgi:hypothetical protein
MLSSISLGSDSLSSGTILFFWFSQLTLINNISQDSRDMRDTVSEGPRPLQSLLSWSPNRLLSLSPNSRNCSSTPPITTSEWDLQHLQYAQNSDEYDQNSPALKTSKEIIERRNIPPSPPHDISQHVSPFFQPLLRRLHPGLDEASLISNLRMHISPTERNAIQCFTDFCRSLSDLDDGYRAGQLVPPAEHLQFELVRVIETIVFLIPSMVRASDYPDDLNSYIDTMENLLQTLRNLATLTVADLRI